jgi:LPS sulfotransferase NodH
VDNNRIDISKDTSTGSEVASGIENGTAPIGPFHLGERIPIVAMIAIQRSGTHLLREILNSNSRVAMSPEPFNRDTASFCWEKFINALPNDKQRMCDSEGGMQLLDEFIEALNQDVRHNRRVYGGRKRRQRIVGLDIKYNQLKAVSPAYNDLRLRPFLLDYLRAREARIIHLVRRNLVHTAISAIIANIRKVWQNYDGASIGGPYRISPNELFQYVRWIKEEREAFEGLAGDLSVHKCYYEDIVADLKSVTWFGRLRQDTTALSGLAAFLNVPNRFWSYGYIRKVINRPYKELIENYDEVMAALIDSPFSEFAETLEPRQSSATPPARAA